MYYGFLVFVLTYAVHIAAHIESNEVPTGGCMNKYDCKYLYDYIANYVDESKDVCQDVYSFTCNSTDGVGIFSEEFMRIQYVKLIEHVEYILNDFSYMAEFQPIKKERKLYKQCMSYDKNIKYDSNKQINKEAKKKFIFLNEMYDNASEDLKWGILDRKLFSEGFGYAFFNIRVIPDPRNSDINIIVLEPPSFDSFTEIYETLKSMQEFSKNFNEPKTDIEKLLYRYVKSDKSKYIQKLVQAVTEAIFNSTNDFADNGSQVTSIDAWHSDFSKRYERTSVTNIDWFHMLNEAFNKVGVEIYHNTPILVKNKMYFSKLFDILFETPNEVLATSIVIKAVTQNLKLIDWNLASKIQLISDEHRSEFCLHNTKLYGVSYSILKEYNKYLNFNLHELTNRIVRTLINEIERSRSLSYNKEIYLKSELDSITSYVQKSDIYLAKMVETIYEGYEFDSEGSYLDNILEFRKIIKQNELLMLKYKSRQFKAYLPFSIIDLIHPANRFTINLYLTSLSFDHNIAKPEIIYGKYGVQIASVLYALLNENKLEDYPLPRYTTFPTKHHLSAHPDYDLKKIECVIPGAHKHNKKQYFEAISNVYGLQIAHKALKPSANNLPLFPEVKLNHIKQFFYLEYVKAHCYMKKDVINSIVLRDESFYTSFDTCKRENVKCSVTIFDQLSKNIFLIQA